MRKYDIIYADPPWEYKESGSGSRVVSSHYPTMDINAIKRMPIQNIASENSILFLWATFPRLPECLEVISCWGFRYKGLGFCWVKVNKSENVNQQLLFPKDRISLFWGMGYYTRQNPEVCLIGVRGKIPSLSNNTHSILVEEIRKHSQKPDIVRRLITDVVGDLPRIELFAREKNDGWDVFGNEVETKASITNALSGCQQNGTAYA